MQLRSGLWERLPGRHALGWQQSVAPGAADQPRGYGGERRESQRARRRRRRCVARARRVPRPTAAPVAVMAEVGDRVVDDGQRRRGVRAADRRLEAVEHMHTTLQMRR